MRLPRGVYAIGLALLLMVFGAVAALANQSPATSQDPPWPTVQPMGMPDSADMSAIQTVIDLSYAVRTTALQQLNASQYPTVYVDDQSVPLGTTQNALLQTVSSAPNAPVPGLGSSGFLSYETSYVVNLKRAVTAWNALQAKAQAEHRLVTAADRTAIQGIVGGPMPMPVIVVKATHVSLRDVRINNNRADVQYEDGAALQHAMLVKTADGWKIAGVRPLNIHL